MITSERACKTEQKVYKEKCDLTYKQKVMAVETFRFDDSRTSSRAGSRGVSV